MWLRELSSGLRGHLEGWGGGGGRRFRREGKYVYLWLIHADVWQKPTQHCKAIIVQLKIKLKKILKALRIKLLINNFNQKIPSGLEINN